MATAWRAPEARVAHCASGQPRAAYPRAQLIEKGLIEPRFTVRVKAHRDRDT